MICLRQERSGHHQRSLARPIITTTNPRSTRPQLVACASPFLDNNNSSPTSYSIPSSHPHLQPWMKSPPNTMLSFLEQVSRSSTPHGGVIRILTRHRFDWMCALWVWQILEYGLLAEQCLLCVVYWVSRERKSCTLTGMIITEGRFQPNNSPIEGLANNKQWSSFRQYRDCK